MAKAGLAGSPPVPVPRPLRPFVRFAKLSDRAVSTVRRVLDDDEAFRTHVCTMIELADIDDELDEPSLLFLRRPEGWQEALDEHAAAAAEAEVAEAAARAEASASRRLEAVQASLARTQDELEALREMVTTLREQLGEERRARRMAESDLGRLRKRLAEVTPDGEDVDPARPEPSADREAGERAIAAAEARAEAAEVSAGRERARAEAAERALEVAEAAAALRPTGDATPEAPGYDHGAVADAVSAAVSAVGSLAEALGRAAEALAPVEAAHPPWPPADVPGRRETDRPAAPGRRIARAHGRSPVSLPPAVFDDTVDAALHLLRVPGVLVLVDGYNVTLTARGDLALGDQRRWLLDAAAGAAARTGATFRVVFDGSDGASAPADRSRRLGVEVRFTAADVEADDVLLDVVSALPADQPAVVVSDDHRVRDGARRLGANVLGVTQLVEALRR